jgi:uncharacterized protein (TIGR02265 family)
MTERYFYNAAVEAQFLRAFPATKPELVAAYGAAGLDVTKPLLPAYEYAVWRRCLTLQREALLPGLSVDAGCEEQGRRYVASYFETSIGSALKVLLRVLSTQRILERMSRNFRSNNSFSVVTMTSTGPKSALLDVNDVFAESPLYIKGMLENGFACIGREMHLSVKSHEGDAALFEAMWP